MKTRQRRTAQDSTYLYDDEESLDFEHLSDTELEALLFDEEEEPKSGLLNLPTITGFAMILVGLVYLVQTLAPGLIGFPDLGAIAQLLPWLGAIMIMLLGFGVLSWSPSRKKKLEDKLKAAHMKAQAQAEAQLKSQLHAQRLKEQQAKVNQKLKELRKDGSKKKLRKSRDKKISGVAAGIAEYLNVDPTLIRIAFVACLPFFWFFTPLTYVILGMILPDAERQLGEFKDDSDKARKNRNRRSSGDDERRIKISRD